MQKADNDAHRKPEAKSSPITTRQTLSFGPEKNATLENVYRGNYNRLDGVCCERLTVK